MFDELVEAFHHIGAAFEDFAHEVAEWYETIVELSKLYVSPRERYRRYQTWRKTETYESNKAVVRRRQYETCRCGMVVLLRGNVQISAGKKTGQKKVKDHFSRLKSAKSTCAFKFCPICVYSKLEIV